MTHHVAFGSLFASRIWAVLIGMGSIAVVGGVMQYMHLLDGSLYVYVLQPILVVCGAILVGFLSRGAQSRLRRQNEKMTLVVSIMSLWIIGYFLTGIVVTYVQNPLMGSFRSILLSVIAYGVVSIGLEYIRYRIVISSGRRNLNLSGLILALIFTLFQLSPVLVLFRDSDLGEMIKVVVAVVIPIVSYNFIQTYLAYTAGFGAMLVYASGWLVMNIFLPITPHYDWYMIGMMSLCLGLLTVLVLDRTRQDRRKPLRYTHHHRRWVNDGIFLLVVVGLVGLMTGVFSYKPLVIMSNSMVPVYSRGDMVFVEQSRSEMDITVGDIIEYRREDRVITHRVVKIADTASGPVYTAKGDNNQSDDPWPITRSQIKGIVKAKIPYIGYPSVVINELIQQKK